MGNAQARRANEIRRGRTRLRSVPRSSPGTARLVRGEAPSRIRGKKKAPRTNPRRHGCERGVLALLPSPAPDDGVLNVDVRLRRPENLGQVDRIHGSGVRTAELKQLEGLLEDRQ